MLDAALVAARRTPIAGPGRGLRHADASALGAAAVHAAATDAVAFGPPRLLVLGDCMGPGGNLARVAALGAGLDATMPAFSVDLQCGSGMLAVQLAAESVTLHGGLVIAGGAESRTHAPERSVGGVVYHRARFAPEGTPDPDMPDAAEALAARAGISRAACDRFALRSHALALEAARRGAFDAELVPVPAAPGARDDGPRSLTATTLARFPALAPRAVPRDRAACVTAGTTARLADAAAAVGVVRASDAGTAPHVRIVATAHTAGDVAVPGIGAAAAIEHVVRAAGVSVLELTALELVEAFAAQTLAVLDALGPREALLAMTNPDGGALAFGHPWAASGAIALVRLTRRMLQAPPGSMGVAACSIGGGQGTAVLVVREGSA